MSAPGAPGHAPDAPGHAPHVPGQARPAPGEHPERPFAITLDVGSSLANRTGAWRTERPQYVRRLPPCNNACPAGEDIQRWLYEGESGGEGYERAWRVLVRENPFPAVMGRICYHPCETECNRCQLDEAVGINSVERFLGDEAIARGWQLPAPGPASGRRVLVVGAGPSGLSAAYHLALRGHHVTVKDAAAEPGGMMRYGIPAYRLPRAVLDAEIARILALGVELRCGERVEDLQGELRAGHHDAAFLAVGAHVARNVEIPGGTAAHIVDAIGLLHGLAEGERPQLGRRVVVYGGGDTALDAARSARRLTGAEPVIVYRRTRERMPAHLEELEQAQEEGIAFRWLSTIVAAGEGPQHDAAGSEHGADGAGEPSSDAGEPDGGPAATLRIERMRLDEQGMPQPTGEYEQLDADSVILALGQSSDLSLLGELPGVCVEDGVVAVDERMMTGHPGVFAGGDMTPGERMAAVAIGHGRRAARCVDGWLRGVAVEPPPRGELAGFDALNTWYYADAPRTVRPLLEDVRRQSTFEEVVKGLGEDSALFEARRCLSCGNCFACDNCYGVCPDNAVLKPGPPGEAYAIDLDFCKGCGMCAAECPCGAIEMIPEEI
ncbi:MAG TPA: NAD(P)-binding protein [Solirubrobacteraceae bacterium]|nr:NAD(P)-binding protein [Solirubrobacteraceae bacterium]